jgi:serine/threonine protein kinase
MVVRRCAAASTPRTRWHEHSSTRGRGRSHTRRCGGVEESTRPPRADILQLICTHPLQVAIKVIDKKDAEFDADSLEQEIAIMKKVDHPNCIKLHEVYDEKSKMYMVLDLVTGGELFDR